MFVLKGIQNLVFGSNIEEEPIENPQPLIDIDTLCAKSDSNSLNTDDLETKDEISENLCEDRVGKVLYVKGSQVLIDEGLQFDTTDFPDLKLVEGDRVAYTAYRKEVHHDWRIKKILYVVEDDWAPQLSDTKTKEVNEESEDAPQSTVVPKGVLQRTLVCQIKKRIGRKLVLRPGDVVCDLDSVNCKFVPLEGDWIELEAVTEVDKEVCDLKGEVLDVEEIRPLRSRIHVGVITHWNCKEGIINKDTYFNSNTFEPQYSPVVGQKVVVESIESHQGHLTWRALRAVYYPAETHSKENLNNNTESGKELNVLLQNKRGIVISEVLNFGLLNIGEKKDILVEIKNKGRQTEVLYHCRSKSKLPESQFRCLYPYKNEEIIIKPGQTVECKFSCKGKFVGKVTELFVFSFRGFKIGRCIEAEVQHPSQTQLLPTKGYSNGTPVLPESYQFHGNYVAGVRPLKPPAFIPVRIPPYSVPNKYFDVMAIKEKKHRFETVLQNLKEMEPALRSGITMSSYAKRFHALLFIEEVQNILNMRVYDMKRIQFTVAGPLGEYYAVDIPGLTEKRPSLLVGNRALAKNSDESDQGHQKPQVYEGFIHKICQSQVWLKFHASFHATYKDEEFNISFLYGRTPMRRCHSAVDLAVKHLGEKMLSPAKIEVQPPQLHFEEYCNQSCSCRNKSNSEKHSTPEVLIESWHKSCNKNKSLMHHLNDIAKQNQQSASRSETSQHDCNLAEEFPELAKRKIKWLNPSLNSYQKDAVINVLKGQGRPLPYVIFGPPGTGKTMTTVEAILQTLILLPHSRILVATPSNSSADLLAERLLDSGVLKPGDLVRLVAFNYFQEGKIPEKLLPYCTTADIGLARDSPKSTTSLEAPLKLSTSAQVLGRHRITVGTCICLGQLYIMGFTRDHFTHVFVDEAGQATEPEIMIPLVFLNPESGQIVLAGDPLQLGPVVISALAEKLGLSDSYLSRLMQCSPYQRDECGFPDTGGYNPLVVTQLRMNYRSVPEILNVANTLFYNSTIKAHVSQTEGPEAELLALVGPKLLHRSPEDGGPPAIIFHGIRGQNFQEEDSPSWFNPQEIVETLNYANILYDVGLTPDDIGIITPYQKQVMKMRIFFEEFEVPCPKIGSVEEFQGQERKVIILSAVRSTLSLVKVDVKYSLGFVASPKRLNVSLTRARALLIILGNPHLLAVDPLWRRVLKYCVDHKVYRGCDLPIADDLCNLSNDD